MHPTDIKAWVETMRLIAQYDWAVETDAESYNGLDRETARTLRRKLIKMAGSL